MPSIGELFIQLGVLGNANELKKANQELQKSNILTQKQTKLEKARAEALEKIQKAQTRQEKREIAKRYQAKKANIEKEANLKMQLAENKALKGNIAQWATYAHAVSMASSIAVSSLKKVYSEIDKVMNYGLNMKNIGMTTSTSLGVLQGYGRVAHKLNPNISEESVMQQLARINQAYDTFRAGDPEEVKGLLSDRLPIYGAKAQSFFSRVMGLQIKSAVDFFEGLRDVIAGETPERQVNILRNAGLDESLLPMLRLSRADFEAEQARMMQYALSEQQLEEQANTAIAINEFKQHFQDFVQQVFGTFTPILESLVSNVEKNLPQIFNWVQEFSKKVREHLPEIQATIKRIFDYVFKGELTTVLKNLSHILSVIAKFLGFDAEKERAKQEDAKAKKSIYYDETDGTFKVAEGQLSGNNQASLNRLNQRLKVVGENAFQTAQGWGYGELNGVDFQKIYNKHLREFNANPAADAAAQYMSPINIENINVTTNPNNVGGIVNDAQLQCGLNPS